MIDRSNLLLGPTGITTDGGVFDSTPPNGYMQVTKQMIGPKIVELAEASTGFDVRLDYLDRLDGVHARINCLARLGTDRPDVIFGWDAAPSNVQTATRFKSGANLANWIHLTGAAFTSGGETYDYAVLVFDTTSQARYRARQAFSFVPSITDLTFLTALATTELGFRKQPREIISLVPFAGRAPDPWSEYGIGDTVGLEVGRRLRGGYSGVARVYGWDIDMGDVERVTNLIVSPE